jgi:hypothetical protein
MSEFVASRRTNSHLDLLLDLCSFLQMMAACIHTTVPSFKTPPDWLSRGTCRPIRLSTYLGLPLALVYVRKSASFRDRDWLLETRCVRVVRALRPQASGVG